MIDIDILKDRVREVLHEDMLARTKDCYRYADSVTDQVTMLTKREMADQIACDENLVENIVKVFTEAYHLSDGVVQ